MGSLLTCGLEINPIVSCAGDRLRVRFVCGAALGPGGKEYQPILRSIFWGLDALEDICTGDAKDQKR